MIVQFTMEYPPFSFPELSPEEKSYIDSILHPKVKGNADGNCVVNTAKMQELHTLLGTLSSDLDRMNKLTRKMLFDAAYGKEYSGFDVVEQSRVSGKAKRLLYDINMKFEDALGMNYTRREENFTQCIDECNARRKAQATQDKCEQFVHDSKEVLLVARAKLVEAAAQPLAPISIKHAEKEEEEDLYA